MSKRAAWILVTSAGLVVVVCVGVAIWGLTAFVSGGRVRPLIDDLKAKGEPVSISEIAPPKVPDSENAAIIYARAFELLPKGQANSEFRKLDEFVWRTEIRKSPDEWTTARRMVARYAGALALAEGGAARPRCRFPVDWEKGWEVEMPHLQGLGRLSVLAAARALIEARAGRTQQAVDSLALGVRIGESLHNEPTLVPYLWRIASAKRSARCLEGVLSYCSIGEDQASRLDSALSKIDLIGAGANALRGERACGIDSFERFVGRVVEGRGRGPDGFKHPRAGDESPPFGSGVVRTFFQRDEAQYIRAMTEFIDHADVPYRVMARARKPARANDRDLARLPSLRGMFLPHMGSFARVRDEGIAAVLAGRLMLALAEYRAHSGSYPSTLADVESKLKRKLPHDPFSGKRFGYRKDGRGCVIYSIGPDLKDDGGVEAKPSNNKSDRVRGDIVWRLGR